MKSLFMLDLWGHAKGTAQPSTDPAAKTKFVVKALIPSQLSICALKVMLLRMLVTRIVLQKLEM